MTVWIKSSPEAPWHELPNVLAGLLALVANPKQTLLLTVATSDPEIKLLRAAGEMAALLGLPPHALQSAAEHPTYAWSAALQEAGTDAFWWRRERPVRRNAPVSPPRELIRVTEVCPFLNSVGEPDAEHPVCGTHGDRMMLSCSHLQRWCLGEHDHCPHYRDAPSQPEGARSAVGDECRE